MGVDEAEFIRRAEVILQRFLAQNENPVPEVSVLHALALRLWDVVRERGLLPPLAPGEQGQPGGMADSVLAPLVARIAGARPKMRHVRMASAAVNANTRQSSASATKIRLFSVVFG